MPDDVDTIEQDGCITLNGAWRQGGVPDVGCFRNGFQFEITTKNPFIGRLYIRGMYSNPACSKMFPGKTKSPSLLIAYDDCIHQRQSMDTPGMMYTADVVAQFHPFFTTKADKGFVVMCMYREGGNTVMNNQVLQGNADDFDGSYTDSSGDPADVRIDRVSYAPIMPKCSYTILKDSPSGQPTSFAKVGQKVYHKWECAPGIDGQFHGLQVHSCTATDNKQNSIKLLDERGCTLDPLSMPTPVYSQDLSTAVVEVWAFKFAESLQISFTCSISLCLKMNDRCRGITPPTCNRSSTGYGGTNEESQFVTFTTSQGNPYQQPSSVLRPPTTFPILPEPQPAQTFSENLASGQFFAGQNADLQPVQSVPSGYGTSNRNQQSQAYYPPGYSPNDTISGIRSSNLVGSHVVSNNVAPLPNSTFITRGLSFLDKNKSDNMNKPLTADFFNAFVQDFPKSKSSRKRETNRKTSKKIARIGEALHIPMKKPKIDFDAEESPKAEDLMALFATDPALPPEELDFLQSLKSDIARDGSAPHFWLERKDGSLLLKSEEPPSAPVKRSAHEQFISHDLMHDIARKEFVVFDEGDDTFTSETDTSDKIVAIRGTTGLCLSMISTIHISLALVFIISSLTTLLIYFYTQTRVGNKKHHRNKKLPKNEQTTDVNRKNYLTDLICLGSERTQIDGNNERSKYSVNDIPM